MKCSIEKLQGQNTLKTGHDRCWLVKVFEAEDETTITCFPCKCTMTSSGSN